MHLYGVLQVVWNRKLQLNPHQQYQRHLVKTEGSTASAHLLLGWDMGWDGSGGEVPQRPSARGDRVREVGERKPSTRVERE